MGGNLTYDLTHLPEFVRSNNPETKTALTDTVDLYIDYSTCLVEAKNSSYYKATHPSIVDCSPVFYSIKGSKITRETDNRQQVYTLLSEIREVNNADIKEAVTRIVNGNHQAVLITDGEYFLKGSVKDNLNNPYLAEDFRTWVSKGYDIYFYSEPYVESGRFNKYRYYILFTDDNIDNNINDRFMRSAPEDARVVAFHLNDGKTRMSFDKDYPDINVSLSPSENTSRTSIDVQEYLLPWSDMYEYLMEGSIKERYLLRGLFVDNSENNSYKIKEIKPVVYGIYEEYQEYCDSVAAGRGNLPKAGKFKEIEDVFEIDEDIFEETGEIVLKLDDDFDGVGDALSYEYPNLLRVDFVVTEAENNFSYNEEVASAFKWSSISAAQRHAENTSLYESISLVLKDPKLNPEKRGLVLYSVYLSTMSL